jgi:NADPH-dependent methylglyoxal reductase
MSEAKKIALVTGASGYAAGHIIKGLTERGYHVRGTVRSKGKAQQLTALFPEVSY